jgi:hypothetical protein
MTADPAALGARGIDTERAVALGRALLKLARGGLEAFGPPAAFAAGMGPTPTASPALDEAPEVHDVPDPENGVARSEDSDGPYGTAVNESSKKNYARNREKTKASSKASVASNMPPPPDQQDPNDDQDEEPPAFKKPSRQLKPGDRVDLDRFKIRSGKKGNVLKRDPKTGYTIQKDTGEHGWKDPPRAWKLRDQFGNLVGSLDETGKYLADKEGY